MKGLDEKIVAAYYRYMVDIAVLFGADRNRATKELRESLDFEINLANVSILLATKLRLSLSPSLEVVEIRCT